MRGMAAASLDRIANAAAIQPRRVPYASCRRTPLLPHRALSSGRDTSRPARRRVSRTALPARAVRHRASMSRAGAARGDTGRHGAMGRAPSIGALGRHERACADAAA
ncbi:hypothetical protein AQ941_22990 [Burkholderia pseudomallei]|nr:hypothetical protein AQ913_06660 [Burkholderia pseudomallei]ONC66324.1 hypothetical protein AQ920_08260 [Burkholderia pseudomallei]OND96293.1 hypothetical protein AQ941_22990 [Burkholderia pseudomallei]